jgi:hypothetical protein
MTTPALNSKHNTVACVGALVAAPAVGLGICAMALAAGASLGAALLTAATGGLALGLVAGLLLWLIMRRQGAVEGVTQNQSAAPAERPNAAGPQQPPSARDPVSPADPGVQRPEAVDVPNQLDEPAFLARWAARQLKELNQLDFCLSLNLDGVCLGAALVWLKERLSNTLNSETWPSFFSRAQKIQAFYVCGARRPAANRYAAIGAQPMIFGERGGFAPPVDALRVLRLQNKEGVDLETDQSLVDLMQNSPVGFAVEIALFGKDSGGHAVAALRIESGVEFFDANYGHWQFSDDEWAEFFPTFRQLAYADLDPVFATPIELAASAGQALSG